MRALDYAPLDEVVEYLANAFISRAANGQEIDEKLRNHVVYKTAITLYSPLKIEAQTKARISELLK